MQKKEKRKFLRLSKSFPIRFSPANKKNEIEIPGRGYKAYAKNISGGGLSIELNLTKNLLKNFLTITPQEIALDFNIPETKITVIGTAEIVWIGAQDNKNQKLGLKFLEIKDEQRKTVIDYISNQIKIKENLLKNIGGFLKNILYYRILKPLLFTSRLGRRSMFGYADSGLNFDHIYKNVAKGYTRFGIIIDKILLNLPSAKATRYRKERIIEILKAEIKKNIACGKKTKIVDLASGPSRYLVELITEENKDYVEGLCLDIDRRNLEFGRKLAVGKPLLFKKANVLNLNHYKRFSEKIFWVPNLVLCSGLYEYLEAADVQKSLSEIFTSLDKEGFLLFVTQMDSPDRELIEKLGKIRQGKSWFLFYRDPSLLKCWMSTAGFRENDVKIDPWKMYVFCSGRKILDKM
jgi:SAM-dependent methyltransferase